MVECHLAKVKVAGPNPVSRSIVGEVDHSLSTIPALALQWHHSQVVRHGPAKP